MLRRALTLLVLGTLAALATALAGCGGRFPLPTESRGRVIASDKSYQIQASWTGMNDIRAILLTQGAGTQLFLLFNHGGSGTDSRGEVLSYARLKPSGPQTPIAGVDPFLTLFNPAALCSGSDGAGGTRIYVLDQGDTTLARVNPLTHVYGDTTGLATGRTNRWHLNDVSDYALYWHVREFKLLGGDTVSALTDTSLAFPNGVAADDQGRVYVSGLAVVFVPDPQNPSLLTRAFQWRIYRYVRAAGGGDPYMPGCNWRRDNTWLVGDGSGVGTVQDPRAIYWGPAGGGALYVSDFAKNWVQKVSDQATSTGFFAIDGTTAPGELAVDRPQGVVADLQGFIYFADLGNQRVMRYDGTGAYVQKVNVEGPALVAPTSVAADDSLVFVGDPVLAQVNRYKRRP